LESAQLSFLWIEAAAFEPLLAALDARFCKSDATCELCFRCDEPGETPVVG
jgi:hypothetical protein